MKKDEGFYICIEAMHHDPQQWQ
jgi:cytochrome P450